MTGDVVYFQGDKSFNNPNNLLGFDLSQQECADWWLSECINMTKTGYFDGCSFDRCRTGQWTWNNIPVAVNMSSQAMWYNRKVQTFLKAQKYLNDTNLSTLFIHNDYK